MRLYLNAFVDLLFPRVCSACSETLASGEEILCTSCRFALPRTDSHQTGDTRIAEKFYGKVELASAHAYLKFSKGSSVQRLLHALKYRNQPGVGQILGKLYGAELRQAGRYDDGDLIIPVPLHRAKLRQRQYNQSDCFAEGLSEAMQIPWSPTVLRKKKATDSQTRKSRFERFQNVNEIFQVTDPAQIQGKTLILVDDVVTTGATLESAARVLLGSGAQSVHVLTIATAL
jgi:ComF family protein